ncbi:IS3 family transposase [Azospirillum aestuarii]
MRRLHADHRERYGAPRIHAALNARDGKAVAKAQHRECSRSTVPF